MRPDGWLVALCTLGVAVFGASCLGPGVSTTSTALHDLETMEYFLRTGRILSENGKSNRTGETAGEREPVQLFHVASDHCPKSQATEFVAMRGVVTGWPNFTATNHPLQKHKGHCHWRLRVPPGYYLVAAIRLQKDSFASGVALPEPRGIHGYGYQSARQTSRYLVFTLTDTLKFHIASLELTTAAILLTLSRLRILFLATKQRWWTKLIVVPSSQTSGKVFPPCFPLTPVPANVNASVTLYAPKNHTLMLSFRPFFHSQTRHTGYVEPQVLLSAIQTHQSVVWFGIGMRNVPAQLYQGSVSIQLLTFSMSETFHIWFTLHSPHARPVRLASGRFNCSVRHYASFKAHLHCDLQQQCEGREDEGSHCPFSSKACDGDVAVEGSKCYRLHFTSIRLSWSEAQARCQAQSAQLAVLASPQQVAALLAMLRVARWERETYVGLLMDQTVPNLYRKTLRWVDGTIAYFTPSVMADSSKEVICHSQFTRGFVLRAASKDKAMLYSYTCEYSLVDQSSVHSVRQDGRLQAIPPDRRNASQTHTQLGRLVVCPGGHWTQDFLLCDLQASCLTQLFELSCPLTWPDRGSGGLSTPRVAMFHCHNLIHTLPFTVVCNFALDCLDGSDEVFCQHDHMACGPSHFQCASGQCLNRLEREARCDRVSDCIDGSDEECSFYHSFSIAQIAKSSVRIDFDRSFRVIMTEIDRANTCPDTHFSCLGQLAYCLPIYVRCNGYYDCTHREDELDCDQYTCPGLYRCRASRVCVDVTHVCDGVEQCPGRDDEMLCQLLCPRHCRCQGLSFVCRQSFPAASFPQLRYLDAGHSLVRLALLTNNSYLLWLSLHHCQLQELTIVSLGNLQTLDVSDNLIVSLSVDFFQHLPNLKEVVLSGNPLVTLTGGHFNVSHTRLHKLDLSGTRLGAFDCRIFYGFPAISEVNISHSGTVRISRKMFTCFTDLNQLDVRGTELLGSNLSLIGQLQHVEAVFSDDYRHCCPTSLPTVEHKVLCLAPPSGFSSCFHLLRSQLHRLCMWLLALLSFLGNLCCLLAKRLHRENVKSPCVDVLVFHLAVASVVMGVYVCIIIAADWRFRGQFVHHEREWTGGAGCRTATALAVVSSHGSSLVVLVLSVERLLAVCCSSRRLKVRSAWLAGALSLGVAAVWCCPVLLYAEPGMSNVCLPLPVRGTGSHWTVSLWTGVVTFNTTLSLITAILQWAVVQKLGSLGMVAAISQASGHVVLARRLTALVVGEVVGRAGLTALEVLAYVLRAERLHVMVVLGAACRPMLHPWFYASGLLTEHRKRLTHCRLLQLVTRKIQSRAAQPPPSHRHSNTLQSGSGTRSLPSGAGTNTVHSGAGTNTLQPGPGINSLPSGNGRNTLQSGPGINTLQSGPGINSLQSGPGTNALRPGHDTNTMQSGPGINTLQSGPGTNTLPSGPGTHTLQSSPSTNTVHSGPGRNTLPSGPGTNAVHSGPGTNTLKSGPGTNTLQSGPGTSTLKSGPGRNTLQSDPGRNTLQSGPGTSTLKSGPGRNTLQ